jgi:hypothetical protein
MKKWDRYSLRGVIIMVVGLAGIVFEIGFSQEKSLFVILLYSVIVVFGGFLLLVIKEYIE